MKLERYLKDSQIARKVRRPSCLSPSLSLSLFCAHAYQQVSGYADKRQAREARERQLAEGGDDAEGRFTPSAISAMHAIEAFILSLANRTDDGRVLLSLETPPPKPTPLAGAKSKYARPPTAALPAPAGTDDETPLVSLKYQLLNPSEAFRPIVDEARAVILAGGTMEPVSLCPPSRRQILPPRR